MAELGMLHDSVSFIQHAIDAGGEHIEAAKEELAAALEKWPNAPQLLDAAAHLGVDRPEAASE